jgi:hypothetical protein
MDNTQKKCGVPFSTSRSQEKKNKQRTNKVRRQEGKKETYAIQH